MFSTGFRPIWLFNIGSNSKSMNEELYALCIAPGVYVIRFSPTKRVLFISTSLRVDLRVGFHTAILYLLVAPIITYFFFRLVILFTIQYVHLWPCANSNTVFLWSTTLLFEKFVTYICRGKVVQTPSLSFKQSFRWESLAVCQCFIDIWLYSNALTTTGVSVLSNIVMSFPTLIVSWSVLSTFGPSCDSRLVALGI